MKTSKRDETQVGPDLQRAFQGLNDLIGEFGVESMEVAEAFRILAGASFRIDGSEALKSPTQFDLLTDGGRTLISPVILDRYMFGDPSLTEQHLGEMETAFAFALPIWSKTIPEVADFAVDTLLWLASHNRWVGGPAKWEAMSKRLLNIFRTRLGHQHQDRAVVRVLGAMGTYYAGLHRFGEANSCLKEALAICESDRALRTSMTPRLLSNLARIASARGELVTARMYIDQAMEILEQSPTMDKLMLLENLIESASFFEKMGDVDGFAQESLRAEQVAKEVWESHPDETISFIVILMGCHKVLGRQEEAGRLIRWLAGKIRELASETGIDVLDRLEEVIRPRFGSHGLPPSLEEVLAQIKAERDCPTRP